MFFIYTLLSGLSQRDPVTNASLVVQERGILREGEYRIKFDQRFSWVRNRNPLFILKFRSRFFRWRKVYLKERTIRYKVWIEAFKDGKPEYAVIFSKLWTSSFVYKEELFSEGRKNLTLGPVSSIKSKRKAFVTKSNVNSQTKAIKAQKL